MSLPVIPADKANHIIDGFLAYTVGTIAAQALHLPQPREWGVALAIAAGLVKEASDWYLNRRARLKAKSQGTEPPAPPHRADPLDFLATTTGGFAGFLTASFL
jgi:hypothetical protein